MSDNRRGISPTVALQESTALVEFYRNRVLILAQDNADLRDQLATMQKDAKEKSEESE